MAALPIQHYAVVIGGTLAPWAFHKRRVHDGQSVTGLPGESSESESLRESTCRTPTGVLENPSTSLSGSVFRSSHAIAFLKKKRGRRRSPIESWRCEGLKLATSATKIPRVAARKSGKRPVEFARALQRVAVTCSGCGVLERITKSCSRVHGVFLLINGRSLAICLSNLL